MDSAAVLAVKAGSDPSITRGATITMTINYLAPAQQVDVIAEARVLRRGRSIVFAEVDVLAPTEERIAKGQFAYKLAYGKQ